MTTRVIDLKKLDKKDVDASVASIESGVATRVRIASGHKVPPAEAGDATLRG